MFRASCNAIKDAQVIPWVLRIAERFRLDHFRQLYQEGSALEAVAITWDTTTLPTNAGQAAAAANISDRM